MGIRTRLSGYGLGAEVIESDCQLKPTAWSSWERREITPRSAADSGGAL